MRSLGDNGNNSCRGTNLSVSVGSRPKTPSDVATGNKKLWLRPLSWRSSLQGAKATREEGATAEGAEVSNPRCKMGPPPERVNLGEHLREKASVIGDGEGGSRESITHDCRAVGNDLAASVHLEIGLGESANTMILRHWPVEVREVEIESAVAP